MDGVRTHMRLRTRFATMRAWNPSGETRVACLNNGVSTHSRIPRIFYLPLNRDPALDTRLPARCIFLSPHTARPRLVCTRACAPAFTNAAISVVVRASCAADRVCARLVPLRVHVLPSAFIAARLHLPPRAAHIYHTHYHTHSLRARGLHFTPTRTTLRLRFSGIRAVGGVLCARAAGSPCCLYPTLSTSSCTRTHACCYIPSPRVKIP